MEKEERIKKNHYQVKVLERDGSVIAASTATTSTTTTAGRKFGLMSVRPHAWI